MGRRGRSKRPERTAANVTPPSPSPPRSRLRAFLQAGEVAASLALTIGALTSDDMATAIALFIAAWTVSTASVFIERTISAFNRILIILALTTMFLGFGLYVSHRHIDAHFVRMDVEGVTIRDDGQRVFASVYLQNKGNLPAIGFNHNGIWFPSPIELTNQNVIGVERFLDSDLKNGEQSSATAQTQQDGRLYFTDIYTPGPAIYEHFRSLHYYVYFLSESSYYDTVTRHRSFTDTCQFVAPSGVIMNCPFHNNFRRGN